MKPTRGVALWFLMVMAALALALSGCAGGKSPEPSDQPTTFACADKGKLVRAVVPEAKLVGFDCYFDKYKGKKSLFFKVSLKNVSSEPLRFRVNIFLDNDKAVGGLMPRKGKPPVIKPGETHTAKYPVQGMDTKANQVTLMVKKASY